ncbi:hypothetical protein [Novosphingobium sp. BL-52-GroH]|uniref:hypothetical protein n=1 Tax=Novosphingobium sp. BL-52-GroH TaxID=3349877 RepID=UPI00384A64F8
MPHPMRSPQSTPEITPRARTLTAGFVPSLNQGFVLIEEEESGAARSWDVWVEPFLSEPSFVEAWVSDAEYDYWQNASDPLEFEAAGKSVDQLPLVSNGLPAPLDQMIVDTSSNPGRWIMRDGYIEAVGSTMWLGEKFFECVGKEGNGTGLDDDVLSISSPKHGILKIENKSGPFINVESSTIQNYLRSALYN